MKKTMLFLMMVFLLTGSYAFANDVSIDSDGNVTTGISNTDANLEVTGASGEDGIVGSTSGTGAAGVYGENTTSGNYGLLGDDNYGVYGNSSGWAGYFQGNARITGNLTLDGLLLGYTETDPQVGTLINGKWCTSNGTSVNCTSATPVTSETDPVFAVSAASGITSAQISNWDTAYGWGNHASAGYDTTNDSWTGTGNVYTTSGNVGIGTTAPYYALDVRGSVSSYLGYFYNNNNTSGGSAYGLYAFGDAYGTGTGYAYGSYFIGQGGNSGGNAYGTSSYAYAYGSSNAYGVYSYATGGSTTGREYAFYGVGDAYVSGNVGIGTTTPAQRLDVSGGNVIIKGSGGFDTIGDSAYLYLGDTGGYISNYLSNTSPLEHAMGFRSAGDFTFYPQGVAALRICKDGFVSVRNGACPTGTGMGTGDLQVSGNIGIGTTTPAYRLHAVSTTTYNNNPAIYGENAVTDWYGIGVKGVGLYKGVDGRVSATGVNSYFGVYGYAYTSGGGGTTYGVYGYANGGSTNYGVKGVSYGSGYGGHFYSGSGTGIYASTGSSSGYAAEFRGNVKIISQSTGATVMELGEGLDYAEGFDVSDESKINAGTVLIIDPENPGKLMMSNKAYDTKVAGIVAGANGLGSGVRLGADRFDSDVALAGRVYCNVDTTEAGIQPGDLLTTANIAGYAMKATDYQRAQGAILGKAMESLEKGKKGQILVLVTLQ